MEENQGLFYGAEKALEIIKDYYSLLKLDKHVFKGQTTRSPPSEELRFSLCYKEVELSEGRVLRIGTPYWKKKETTDNAFSDRPKTRHWWEKSFSESVKYSLSKVRCVITSEGVVIRPVMKMTEGHGYLWNDEDSVWEEGSLKNLSLESIGDNFYVAVMKGKFPLELKSEKTLEVEVSEKEKEYLLKIEKLESQYRKKSEEYQNSLAEFEKEHLELEQESNNIKKEIGLSQDRIEQISEGLKKERQEHNLRIYLGWIAFAILLIAQIIN